MIKKIIKDILYLVLIAAFIMQSLYLFRYKKINEEKVAKTCISRNKNADSKSMIDMAIDLNNINGVHIDSAKRNKSYVDYNLKIERNIADIDRILKEIEGYNINGYTFYKDKYTDIIFIEITSK